MTRRELLAVPLAAAAAPTGRLPIKKAVELSMLPKALSIEDKCKLAIDCGFEGMECNTESDERQAEAIKRAADAVKLPIHSVMNSAHWKYPLSSSDPAVVAESMKGMETSLRNAKLWGASTVLLVPAVVNPQTSYQDAWTRSVVQIKKLIPLAAELKVAIGIEEVWNKFLLSPLEMARYVDDFKSPWIRAYFDVGNVVQYGFPQDWIRTLNKRICKLHFKDYRFEKMKADFVNLRDGQIDWKAIHAALGEVGYNGYATVELAGGDAAYLKDVSQRVDAILNGV